MDAMCDIAFYHGHLFGLAQGETFRFFGSGDVLVELRSIAGRIEYRIDTASKHIGPPGHAFASGKVRCLISVVCSFPIYSKRRPQCKRRRCH